MCEGFRLECTGVADEEAGARKESRRSDRNETRERSTRTQFAGNLTLESIGASGWRSRLRRLTPASRGGNTSDCERIGNRKPAVDSREAIGRCGRREIEARVELDAGPHSAAGRESAANARHSPRLAGRPAAGAKPATSGTVRTALAGRAGRPAGHRLYRSGASAAARAGACPTHGRRSRRSRRVRPEAVPSVGQPSPSPSPPAAAANQIPVLRLQKTRQRRRTTGQSGVNFIDARPAVGKFFRRSSAPDSFAGIGRQSIRTTRLGGKICKAAGPRQPDRGSTAAARERPSARRRGFARSSVAGKRASAEAEPAKSERRAG